MPSPLTDSDQPHDSPSMLHAPSHRQQRAVVDLARDSPRTRSRRTPRVGSRGASIAAIAEKLGALAFSA
jgi:hypothetical protein